MLKKLIAATRKWLHRLRRGSAPSIGPEQAKERASALGEANNIATIAKGARVGSSRKARHAPSTTPAPHRGRHINFYKLKLVFFLIQLI